jgi:hypothetical protein
LKRQFYVWEEREWAFGHESISFPPPCTWPVPKLLIGWMLDDDARPRTHYRRSWVYHNP